MSHTTRKPLRTIEENEETYIKRQLNRRYSRWTGDLLYTTKSVRRKKPQEQWLAEYDAAWAEYHAKLKKASYDSDGHPYLGVEQIWRGIRPIYLREPYVSRYHRIEIPWSIEQEEVELRQEYREYTRDGHWNETGRNTGFKKAAAKTTRIGNRLLEKKILKDEDYDHLPYPNEHDGDHLVWNFW